MAIQVTRTNYDANGHRTEAVTEAFIGRVVAVVKSVERCNMSDTLDYTDFRDATVVRALVWLGTRGERPRCAQGRQMTWVHETICPGEIVDLEVHEQFAWVDCSNHFTWRGGDHLTPVVDQPTDVKTDPLMWVNYIAWQGFQKAQAEAAAEKAAKHEAQVALQIAAVEAERARRAALQPKLGDKCKVVSGRKVPKGMMGIVAYMNDHSVLIKAEHEWKNRQANGTWVSKNHVERV